MTGGLTAPGAFSPWDDLVLLALGGFGALYAFGAFRLASRGVPARRRERVAFAAGWVAALLAVLPPIDALAIELFSIHMLQHELIMLVSAPLMTAGRPLAVCLWALPARWRVTVGSTFGPGRLAAAWRIGTAPVFAWVLHGAVIWIWHLPALYSWAVGNEAVHGLQHAMFMGTAVLFWWGLLHGRYGRIGYGAAVFYVFTTAMHTGLLGALLTLSTVAWYPVYTTTTLAHGLDAVADQQIAGLLMWIGAGVLFTLLGIALFAAWLGEAERRGRLAPTRLP